MKDQIQLSPSRVEFRIDQFKGFGLKGSQLGVTIKTGMHGP